MAWEYNDDEVTHYITLLNNLTDLNTGSVETGIDNYQTIITYVTDIVTNYTQEKQMLLSKVNAQLSKYQYYVTQLTAGLDDSNLYTNLSTFQSNAQSLGGTISPDMTSVTNNIIAVVTTDTGRLSQYKRQVKELLAKSIYLQNVLLFYVDAATILVDLQQKLDDVQNLL